MATAVAGACLAINPFDQPNVQESKDNTKRLLEEFKQNGTLPEQTLVAEGQGLQVFLDAKMHQQMLAQQQKLAPGSPPEIEPADGFIKGFLNHVPSEHYLAFLNYIQETPEHEEMIQAIRSHLRDALRVATTTGYGPRFLHSTGQLHKGGADNGVFIQITSENVVDVPLPGEPFTFGILKQAQALGDFESLASRQRRAIRVHLGQDAATGLRSLLEIVRRSFQIRQGQAL
jgi:hypothetical protein